MQKFKITYFDYGIVKAKLIISDWYGVISAANNHGIIESQILKIEIPMEVEEVIDETGSY